MAPHQPWNCVCPAFKALLPKSLGSEALAPPTLPLQFYAFQDISH